MNKAIRDVLSVRLIIINALIKERKKKKKRNSLRAKKEPKTISTGDCFLGGFLLLHKYLFAISKTFLSSEEQKIIFSAA